MQSVDIMAVGAHPDDIEYGAGGILAKMASLGKTMVWVDLCLGDKGTHGTPEIRKKEGENAAKLVGAKKIYLDFKDCEIFDTYEGRLKIVRLIREYRPRLVLAPAWDGTMNHPDHLACGKMCRYACRFARYKNVLPEIPPHAPQGILHYIYPDQDKVDFYVDVSDHVEVWLQMMQCHESQHQTRNFSELRLAHAARCGVVIGKNYAQGLMKGNPIIIEDLMTIAQGTREL